MYKCNYLVRNLFDLIYIFMNFTDLPVNVVYRWPVSAKRLFLTSCGDFYSQRTWWCPRLSIVRRITAIFPSSTSYREKLTPHRLVHPISSIPPSPSPQSTSTSSRVTDLTLYREKLTPTLVSLLPSHPSYLSPHHNSITQREDDPLTPRFVYPTHTPYHSF